jgi:hypoxanthine phosphoribosyltransferase
MTTTYEQLMQQSELLYDLSAIEQALDSVAEQLNRDYAELNPLLLCVLNGAVMTLGYLSARLRFPMEQDYIHASRYGDKTVGGELSWKAAPQTALANRHVLLIDDIYDEGVTLAALREHCEQAGASSVRCMVLADKQHDKKHGPRPEYIGLSVPDRYVFGFGMDYEGYWRNLPSIYALKETL